MFPPVLSGFRFPEQGSHSGTQAPAPSRRRARSYFGRTVCCHWNCKWDCSNHQIFVQLRYAPLLQCLRKCRI
jgi:hypothetical protein